MCRLVIAAILFILAIIAPHAGSKPQYKTRFLTEENKLVTSNDKFALAFLNNLTSNEVGNNVVCSPIIISLGLGMIYAGADGKTFSQIKEVMHVRDLKRKEVGRGFRSIISSLTRPNRTEILYVIDRLFADKSFKIERRYLRRTNKFYGAQLDQVDFKKNSNAAVAEINNWVAQETNQLITGLIPPQDVGSQTVLILVSAIFFNATWRHPFDQQLTKNEPFHITSTLSVPVPMMHISEGNFNYGVNKKLNCQAIELPYNGGTSSMFIILPNTATSVENVQSKLIVDDFRNIKKDFSMNSTIVNLSVPKFNLTTTNSDVTTTLEQMGIKNLFDNKANLAGISRTKNLYVSKVIQKAFVSVTEVGTEAAAASAIIIEAGAIKRIGPQPTTVRCDRPFIFFILDNETGSALFLGRYQDPRND